MLEYVQDKGSRGRSLEAHWRMLPLGFRVLCSNGFPVLRMGFAERASTKTVNRCYRHRETKRQSVDGVDCEFASSSPGAQLVLQCRAILPPSLSCPSKSAAKGEGPVKCLTVMDPRREVGSDKKGSLKICSCRSRSVGNVYTSGASSLQNGVRKGQRGKREQN